MPPKVNMADPDYEPTDEDLARLMQEAFAGVKAANDAALAKIREEIRALGREARSKSAGRDGLK